MTAKPPIRKKPKPRDLDAIVNSLRRIVRAIRVSSHAAEKTSGISGAQLFVLRQLLDEPGMSLRDVARRTLTDESSVSVVVTRLVERGFVKRRPGARDRRCVELSPTAAGRALARRAPEPAQARLVSALREVSARRLHVLSAVLNHVADRMGVANDPAAMFFEADPTPRTRK